MLWILVYNPSNTSVIVDDEGRSADFQEFTYADRDLALIQDHLNTGVLVEVPIYFDPNGSPTGLDPEAFIAAGEVILRNGGSWVPPEQPVTPYTLAQLDALVRTGRLSEEAVDASIDGAVDALDLEGATSLGREVLRAPDQATALDALGVDAETATRTLVQGDNVTITDDGTSVTVAAKVGSLAGLMRSLSYDNAKDATVSTGNGNLRLSYFTANRSGTFTKIRTRCGSTAAGATPTFIKMVAYSVNPANGDLTKIGETASDTSLLATTSAAAELPFVTPVQVTAGQRIALGILVLTSATAPTLQGIVYLNATEAGINERYNGNVPGQTVLLSSIPGTSVADSTSNPYLALVP